MKNLLIILFPLLLWAACHSETDGAANGQEATSAPAAISEVIGPADFLAKLQTTPDAQLLDVRTPGEVALGMIPNCTNIDFNDTRFREQLADLDKEKPVFVYCAKGGRSGAAAKMLAEMGFSEVYDLKGGFTDWQKEGLESVKPEQE